MSGTILVLEDTATNREIMAKMVVTLGYDVLTAINGEDGFKCLDRCQAEGRQLVAVLSDMLMPVVDGPEFVRGLRENPLYEKLPVIFMTNATDKSFLLMAKELKAEYILKPVDMKQLKAKLAIFSLI